MQRVILKCSLLESKIFEEEDGYYVADFKLPDVYFQEGMQVWGWVDMPDEFFDFSTCDPNNGDMVTYYNERYDLGTNYLDILNYGTIH